MSLLLDLEEVRARPRAGLREAPPMDHRGKSLALSPRTHFTPLTSAYGSPCAIQRMQF
jgi:hypothetical protein